MNAVDRFWSYVNKCGPFLLPMKTRCWQWEGAVSSNGYGQIKIAGKMVGVHRFSFEMHKGEIPSHLHVDHICNNKLCVRPGHLRLLTPTKNVRRSKNYPSNRKSCPHGHRYTKKNTCVSGGVRYCRTCSRLRMAERRRSTS